MRKLSFLTCFAFLLLNFQANATRSLYVDDFSSILGDLTAENELLSYSQSNGIETLLLYDLHIVNANYTLSDAASNGILADFISKAKTNYGILTIGAIAENADFFTNVIDAYNNSRSNPDEKFDIYNLEFEFWVQSSTDPGGYYCNTYLTPNGLPCTNDGAFQFFISTLQSIKNLATNNIHPISTEAYVGWPTASQADSIGDNLDRLLLHAYVSDPTTSFNYAESRLIDFADGNPDLDVSIIFSSEPIFMQNWLLNNSMNAAEAIFTEDWQSASSAWVNNIDLVGFTYFAYGFNTNITLSTNPHSPFKNLTIYPNPVNSILYINNPNTVGNIRIYDNLGQLILESSKDQIDFSQFAKGIYSLHLMTDSGLKTKKIVKE